MTRLCGDRRSSRVAGNPNGLAMFAIVSRLRSARRDRPLLRQMPIDRERSAALCPRQFRGPVRNRRRAGHDGDLPRAPLSGTGPIGRDGRCQDSVSPQRWIGRDGRLAQETWRERRNGRTSRRKCHLLRVCQFCRFARCREVVSGRLQDSGPRRAHSETGRQPQ